MDEAVKLGLMKDGVNDTQPYVPKVPSTDKPGRLDKQVAGRTRIDVGEERGGAEGKGEGEKEAEEEGHQLHGVEIHFDALCLPFLSMK